MGSSEDREFDKNMLRFACNFSKLSKDHSTKVGFVLLKEHQTSPSIYSYNGLVSGSNDHCEVRTKTRPEKYFWGEHAERNGLYEAARPLLKNTMVFCAKFPNMDSARAIIVSGIDLVVTDYCEALHKEYLNLVSEQNKNSLSINELNYSDEVKNYARVREYFRENNVTLYHPSRKLAKDGSFLVAESRTSYMETDESDGARFLRKTIEVLDQVIEYANIFCRGNYKDAAFIVRKNTFKSVSTGAHNVPDGYDIFMNDEKEQEYVFGRRLWYIEGVKNAIYNILKPQLSGSRAYVSLCPCLDCAMALNAVGAKKVVTLKPNLEEGVGERWREHFSRTEKFYKEIGMDAIYFSDDELSK